MKLQKNALIEIYKHSLLSYIVKNNVNGIKKFKMSSSSFAPVTVVHGGARNEEAWNFV